MRARAGYQCWRVAIIVARYGMAASLCRIADGNVRKPPIMLIIAEFCTSRRGAASESLPRHQMSAPYVITGTMQAR
jgi:hypothetical protein